MKRRKMNRSRRIVKKLLKRADLSKMHWSRDAVPCDEGKRYVTGLEIMEYNLRLPQ